MRGARSTGNRSALGYAGTAPAPPCDDRRRPRRAGKGDFTQPTVLLLEDLHWIDGQSETAIDALMSLTGRSAAPDSADMAGPRRSRMAVAARCAQVWLRSLDVGSANALLDSLLGKEERLAALKSRILRHTGQIPLFIEEVARQLIGRGVTKADVGQFADKANWDALQIPHSARGHCLSHRSSLQGRQDAFATSVRCGAAHLTVAAGRR